MKRVLLFISLTALVLISYQSAYGQAQSVSQDRAIFNRGSAIALKVPDYDSARKQILESAQAQGAETLDAQTYVNAKGQKHGWLGLRLSSEQAPELIRTIYSIGKLYSEKVTAEDNLSEYQQLARRLDSLKAHEDRLTGVLESPRRMRGSDILYLQERLYRANVDEGSLLQQREDLERTSHLCSLRVELFEPGTMPVNGSPKIDLSRWYAASARIARGSLTQQMARASTATAYVLVYAPIWLPLSIIALILLRWIWLRGRVFVKLGYAIYQAGIKDLSTLWSERRRGQTP